MVTAVAAEARRAEDRGCLPNDDEWRYLWDAAYDYTRRDASAAEQLMRDHLKWRVTSPCGGVADRDHICVDLLSGALSAAR